MGKLDGKVAVITAGSSGMALATAKLFVEEGAYVFISGRDQSKLDKAVKEIGRNVTGIQADSSKVADLERLFDQVKKEKGHIDVLFASAGHGGMVPLGSITEDQFDEFFGLNTRGTLFTIQTALPLLNDGAAIIMNGSIAGIKGLPGLSVYGASKAALRSLARTWAAELKDRKIRTNVLSPGPIDTPLMQAAPEQARAQFMSMVPLGRLGRMEEIASAALFLATNGFVNGTELCVDGGLAQV